MKLILSLYHGRTQKDEHLEDWGSQGPHLIVDWVQWTYGTINHISFTQTNGEEGGGIEFNTLVEDYLFYYNGVWYGDFTLNPITPEIQGEFFDESLTLPNKEEF